MTNILESSYLGRYVLLHGVGIQDYLRFPSRSIANAAPVFRFHEPENTEALAPLLNQALAGQSARGQTPTIDRYLEHNRTVAFLVIQHDRVLFERYYGGYGPQSICTSFSIAKSFVSAMIGVALEEKLISRLDDPITRYLPQLKSCSWSEIRICDLISMSSGLGYKRMGFFPWNDQPRIYYSLDLRRLALTARQREPPGTRFLYNNYNLLLLGMILEQVTGMHVATYLQDKLWKRLGMECPGSSSLDSERSGMEKMESGINALARDFAKLGRLYLRRGDWDGKQVVPEHWVAESTTPWADSRWNNYKYFWWIPQSGKGRFMAVGNLGQFIYVAPDKDCLILRFGNGKPADWKKAYVQLFAAIAEML